MKDKEVTIDFFNRRYESFINENLLEYDYAFPSEEVYSYINSVLLVPMESFLSTAYFARKDLMLKTTDFLQFSSLEDATETICSCYKGENNPGFTAEETGRLLLKNEEPKKLLAYRKYGENHAKAAEALGLVYSITQVYFLSCLGMVYTELEHEKQMKLLCRMVLRTREIEQLYRNYSAGIKTNAREYMGALSDSTYRRRRSNLRRLLQVLEESDEFDFSGFLQSIMIE